MSMLPLGGTIGRIVLGSGTTGGVFSRETLAGAAGGLLESGIKAIFGGDDINVARKFSKRCGLKQPISQDARNKLKKRFPNNEEMQCSVARGENMMTAPQRTFDQFMRALPIPPSPTLFSSTKTTPRTRGEIKFQGPTTPSLTTGGTMATLGDPGVTQLSQTGLIVAVFDCNGRRVTRKKIFQMAKCTTIDAVAAALCTSPGVVAQAIMQECTKKRRRRGITARDLATAKRVNCRVKSMARDLGVTRAPVRRKTSCR